MHHRAPHLRPTAPVISRRPLHTGTPGRLLSAEGAAAVGDGEWVAVEHPTAPGLRYRISRSDGGGGGGGTGGSTETIEIQVLYPPARSAEPIRPCMLRAPDETVILLHPPLYLSRCFHRNREGTSAK